jgi:serine/threonine protein kinase
MQLSDVFSLGIVFYRLANATFPFHEKFLNEPNEHILMYLVVYDLLPYYKKTKIDSHYNQNKTPLDQKINKLIESMLTVSPEQRPSFSNLLQQTQNLINELQQTQNINEF